MSRPYHYGLIVGRFQPLHKGHENLITEALMLCDAVVVYIDSRASDKDNPFSIQDRLAMFQKVFSGNIANKTLVVKEIDLSSVKDSLSIGEFIFSKFQSDFGCLPNLYISGNESLRSKWFNNNLMPNISELTISKKRFNISSSDIRDLFRENNLDACKLYLSAKLCESLSYLKRIIG